MFTGLIRGRWPLLALLALTATCIAACDADAPQTNAASSSSSSSSSGEGGFGGGTSVTVDEFIADAASSVCDALFRCCDETNIAEYFAP